MDTSEQYIKMCEKAEEIQNCEEASKQYRYPRNIYLGKGDYGYADFYQYKHSENIWLPRQDQLQEMVGSFEHCCMRIVQYWDDDTGFEYCTSMEQLWLAFVMKEKYGKVWSGDKWGNKQEQTRC